MIRSTSRSGALCLNTLPGKRIRRLYQISLSLFLQEMQPFGLTPVQFAALQAAANDPDRDQRSLARSIDLDAATTTGVLDRLQARGLIERVTSAEDRRVRRIRATPDGLALLQAVRQPLLRAQHLMLDPLDAEERAQFERLLDKIMGHHQSPPDEPRSATELLTKKLRIEQ